MAAGVAAAALALLLHARAYDFLADDTFITLRYARNLLEGHGLTYNPGERVEGYTSVLWVLLVAALGGIGMDLVVASRLLSLGSALGVLVVVTLLARRLMADERWAAAVPALLVAASAPFACWTLAGMEAPAFALGLSASLLVWLRADGHPRRLLVAGALFGATALIRPEGVLVGVVLCAFEALRPGPRRGRRGAWLAAAFLAVVLVQLAWRVQYYGDWLPNTYHAKVGSGSAALVTRGVTYLGDFARDQGGLVVYLLPLVAAFWRRDRAWWSVAAVLLAQAAAVVYVGGDGLPMYRFVVPLVPLWAALTGALVHDVALTVKARPVRLALVLALGAVAVSELTPSAWSPQYQLYRTQRNYEIPAWTAVGTWLRIMPHRRTRSPPCRSAPSATTAAFRSSTCWGSPIGTSRAATCPRVMAGPATRSTTARTSSRAGRPTFSSGTSGCCRGGCRPSIRPSCARRTRPSRRGRATSSAPTSGGTMRLTWPSYPESDSSTT